MLISFDFDDEILAACKRAKSKFTNRELNREDWSAFMDEVEAQTGMRVASFSTVGVNTICVNLSKTLLF